VRLSFLVSFVSFVFPFFFWSRNTVDIERTHRLTILRFPLHRIGKGGSKIKEIQEASGARLNASESMLPGSTEVSVSLLSNFFSLNIGKHTTLTKSTQL
jgi:hypothetical protein